MTGYVLAALAGMAVWTAAASGAGVVLGRVMRRADEAEHQR